MIVAILPKGMEIKADVSFAELFERLVDQAALIATQVADNADQDDARPARGLKH